MTRHKIIPALYVLIGTVAAAGCASQERPAPSVDTNAVISSTDWSKSETINVKLSNYAFTPMDLTLQHGQPYRIHLVNESGHTHTFSSADFFKTAAVQKVVVDGNESAGLDGDGVTLKANQQADLYLVAVKGGTYDLYCDEFLHDTMGMNGKIVVQ